MHRVAVGRKFFSLASLAFAGLIVLSVLGLAVLILPSFVALDDSHAVQNMERVRHFIAEDRKSLAGLVADLARHDVASEFGVAGLISGRESSRAALEIFSHPIDFWAFITPSTGQVRGLVRSPDGVLASIYSPSLIDSLSSLGSEAASSEPRSGIVMMPWGPSIFASYPVTLVAGTAPEVMVIGKVLDSDAAAAIANRLQLRFDITSVVGGSPEIKALIEAPSHILVTSSRFEDTARVTALMNDYRNQPAILLSLAHTRSSGLLGLRSIAGICGILVLFSITAISGTRILLDREVGEPILGLVERVRSIHRGLSKSTGGREHPELVSENEVALLSHEIEAMLDRLDELFASIEGARQTAVRANDAKSTFLATMTHELRTPLNCIIGFSEMMSNGMVGGSLETHREYATDILNSGRHLLKLINDILDLAKAESGHIQLRTDVVNPTRLILDCIRAVEPLAKEGGLTIVHEFATELLPLSVDETKLRQILLNLLSNSVKFTPEGGRVTIRASTVRDVGAFLTVEDTGIGLSPNDLARVLDPFTQIDNGLTRRHAGTGLGLAVAKRLTEAHGGTLLIASELGRWTRVTIDLPAARVLYRVNDPANG